MLLKCKYDHASPSGCCLLVFTIFHTYHKTRNPQMPGSFQILFKFYQYDAVFQGLSEAKQEWTYILWQRQQISWFLLARAFVVVG